MKRLSVIIYHLSVSVALLLLLASCSKKQGSCLIPDNAFVVMRLDVMKTMENTGMKGDDTSTKKQLEKLIKDAGLEKEVREKLLDIIDDPTSSGIDFTEPVYAFGAISEAVRGGVEGGLVGCVASKGDLTDLLKMAEESDDDITLEEYGSNDVQYVVIDNDAALIFNGDWFFIGTAGKDIDDTIETLIDRADGKDNIEDNEAFKQMCEGKGLMQVGIFGSGIDGLPNASELTRQLPDDCELKDIAGWADFIINNGEIVIESEALPMSDAWKEQVKLADYKDIEKSQAKYADADGALVIVNFEVENFFEQVRKAVKNYGISNSDLRKLDELKPIFDTLTGQGMVAVNSLNENGEPEVVAYVGTRDNSLLETLVGLENDTTGNLIREGNNRYRIPVDYDYDYNDSIGDWMMIPTKYLQAGWQDKQTYFLLNTDDEPFTAARHPFTDVKGVGLYAYASGELLSQAVASIDNSYDAEKASQAVADILDYMELYGESPTKMIYRIAMKKKDKSPVVTIIDYVKHNFM